MRKAVQKKLEASEIWVWRKVEGITCKYKITNEDVLIRVGEIRALLYTVRTRRKRLLGHILRQGYLVKLVIGVIVAGKRARCRRRMAIFDDVENGVPYTLLTKDTKSTRLEKQAGCTLRDLPHSGTPSIDQERFSKRATVLDVATFPHCIGPS